MIHLDLTNDEADELSSALSRDLRGLRTELAATEDRAFKAGLRASLDRLEQVASRLTATAHPAAVPHETGDSRRRERLAQPEEAEAEAEEMRSEGEQSSSEPRKPH